MAGNKVATFRTQFDGNEQTVPAVDNKGEVTITMPATAKPGEKFVLAAQAKDADNRTIGRAEKVITAIAPGIIQPEILSPGQSAYVLNDDIHVTLKAFACTPGYAGKHVSTTYQVATDSAFTDLLCNVTSTTDLTATTLKLTRPLGQKEGAFLRVRMHEETLGDSDWSATHSIAGTQPLAPTVITPRKNALVSYHGIPVTIAPMACLGNVADDVVSTDWQLTDITDTVVYAESMGVAGGGTAFTFSGEGIPKNVYAHVRVRHTAKHAGQSLWGYVTVKISEEEIPVAPDILVPHDYCHPKKNNVILSKISVLNMDSPVCVAAQYKITRDAEGLDIIYDSGETTEIAEHLIDLATPLTPGDKVYFFARQKENIVGWTPWNDPDSMLVARTATPSFTSPKDGGQVFFTTFDATISEFRTQGILTDTHESTDWKVTDDTGTVTLFAANADTVNLTSVHLELPENIMGSYIKLMVRVKGQYTGYSDWVTARVLVHLPMIVEPPSIIVPTKDSFVSIKNVAVQTSPFATENVDNPQHSATLIKVTYDAEGLRTAFLSSEITTGDKTKYTINFGSDLQNPELYIWAKHKDAFAGWSEWGAPQHVTLAKPVAPVIVKPAAASFNTFDGINVVLSGYVLQDGSTSSAHVDTHYILKNTLTGEVYLDYYAGAAELTTTFPEKQEYVGKRMTLLVSFVGAMVGEGAQASVDFRVRRISQGVRIGSSTVVGMPDGSPFTIKGRKLYVAVADSALRAVNGVVFGPETDTLLDNVTPGTGMPLVQVPGAIGHYYYSIGDTTTEAQIDSTYRDEVRDSRHNTHVLTKWYAGVAAEDCAKTIISGLEFQLPSIDVLMRLVMRGEWIDAHDLNQGAHQFSSATGSTLWSSTEHGSTDQMNIGCPYGKGAWVAKKSGAPVVYAGMSQPMASVGYCPVYELPVDGIEDDTVTLLSPDIITYSAHSVRTDVPVSVRTNITPVDTPVDHVVVTLDGGEPQTYPVRNGYAGFTIRRETAGVVHITAQAFTADGKSSPVSAVDFMIVELQPEKPVIKFDGKYIKANDVALLGSAYKMMENAPAVHAATQWQLMADPAGKSITYDSGASLYLTTISVNMLTPLTPRATVYARARYQNSEGVWSEWSAAVSAIVTYPMTPTISSPLDNAILNPALLELKLTDNGMTGGLAITAAMAGGDAKYEFQAISLDEATVYLADSENITSATTYPFHAPEAPRNEKIKIRVRKGFGIYGYSDWAVLTITTQNTRLGERVCDMCTLLGHADGTPFVDNLTGGKYWIGVTDPEYWFKVQEFSPESNKLANYVGASTLPTRLLFIDDHTNKKSIELRLSNGTAISDNAAYVNSVEQAINADTLYSRDGGSYALNYDLEFYTRNTPSAGAGNTYYGSPILAKIAKLSCAKGSFVLPSLGDALRVIASLPLLDKMGVITKENSSFVTENTNGEKRYYTANGIQTATFIYTERGWETTDKDTGLSYDSFVGPAVYATAEAQMSVETTSWVYTGMSATSSTVIPMLIVPDDTDSAIRLGMQRTIRLAQGGNLDYKYAFSRQVRVPGGTGLNEWRILPSRSLSEMFGGGTPTDDALYILQITPTGRVRSTGADDPSQITGPVIGHSILYYRNKFLWLFNPAYATRMNYLIDIEKGGWAQHLVIMLLYKEFTGAFRYSESEGMLPPVLDLNGTSREYKIFRVVAGKIRIQVAPPSGSWPQLLTGEYSSSLSIYIDKGYAPIKDTVGGGGSKSPQPDVSRQLLVQWKTTKKSGALQYVTHTTSSDFFVEQDDINTNEITISLGDALANKPVMLRAVLSSKGTTRTYGIKALGFSYDPADPAGKN